MIFGYINTFLYKYIFFYRYVVNFSWSLGEIIFIVLWIIVIKYRKISGQQTAIVGFILLLTTMMLNVLGFDMQAGFVAEYVYILFVISFIQEFYHFIKYENTK